MHSPTSILQASSDQNACQDGWVIAQQIFDGTTLKKGLALRLTEGCISDVAAAAHATKSGLPVWYVDGTISPGFFDIQVNGGAGVMFNNEPTASTLRQIGTALRASGTTTWLPTFITDAKERMAQAASAILHAHGRDGVAGVHFEGPHINVERRGVHKAQWVRPIDEATFSLLQGLRHQHIPVLLTLAPECQPKGSIARLCAMGVTVAIGHSAANAAQVNDALREGATCFTHLFNGMTPMSSREPGVVGAALDSDAWCGLIADGHHVADTMLRLAIRARPLPHRMVLVSDAMATMHGPNHFDLYGETIQLVDGKLVNSAGSLAGAQIDLAASVHRLIHQVGIPPAQALRMVTLNPAQLMGLSQEAGQIRAGVRADLVSLDQDWRTQPLVLSREVIPRF